MTCATITTLLSSNNRIKSLFMEFLSTDTNAEVNVFNRTEARMVHAMRIERMDQCAANP
jgi:hypothetical protein